MMTGIYSENLCQMVRDGKIREELIDEACLRILRLKNNLGLFENPYKDADQKKNRNIFYVRSTGNWLGSCKEIFCFVEK